MQDLQTHHDGISEGARHKQFASKYLKKIFYKNETKFTIENKVIKVKAMFNIIDKYGVTLYEEYKADHLLY